MNPRGRQFALGGLLTAKVRRTEFSAAETRVLRRCYSGREPRILSRYGVRQWAAVLPNTRMIIKDPFALLSLRAVYEATGATPVLIYRHPAAVLASFRRMGWVADTAEVVALGAPAPRHDGDLHAMATLWGWSHEVALADLAHTPGVLVSHEHMTMGGAAAWHDLGNRLGLTLQPPVRPETTGEPSPTGLHNFDRTAEQIRSGWRQHLSENEIATMVGLVEGVWDALGGSVPGVSAAL
jgi:hypothetical protein